jgi:hypothetical protein
MKDVIILFCGTPFEMVFEQFQRVVMVQTHGVQLFDSSMALEPGIRVGGASYLDEKA